MSCISRSTDSSKVANFRSEDYINFSLQQKRIVKTKSCMQLKDLRPSSTGVFSSAPKLTYLDEALKRKAMLPANDPKRIGQNSFRNSKIRGLFKKGQFRVDATITFMDLDYLNFTRNKAEVPNFHKKHIIRLKPVAKKKIERSKITKINQIISKSKSWVPRGLSNKINYDQLL